MYMVGTSINTLYINRHLTMDIFSTHNPKFLVPQIVHEGRKIVRLKLDMGMPNRVSSLTLLKTCIHRFVNVLFRILAAT